LALQLFAIYVVPEWFNMVPLTADQWIYPIGLVVLAFFVIEIRKKSNTMGLRKINNGEVP
jgi:hypothetical protein